MLIFSAQKDGPWRGLTTKLTLGILCQVGNTGITATTSTDPSASSHPTACSG